MTSALVSSHLEPLEQLFLAPQLTSDQGVSRKLS